MENSSFGAFVNAIFLTGFIVLLFVLILSFLNVMIRRFFPRIPLPRFRLLSAVAAWWSGLNYSVRRILQWAAVIIGIFWLITATCGFGALEILVFLNPDLVSGVMFPPKNLLVVFGWSVIFYFLTGIIALGRTEFDEGPTQTLLDFIKKAALYASVFLSIAGAIFFIAAAALGRGPALSVFIVLFLISIGSAGYNAMNRD